MAAVTAHAPQSGRSVAVGAVMGLVAGGRGRGSRSGRAGEGTAGRGRGVGWRRVGRGMAVD